MKAIHSGVLVIVSLLLISTFSSCKKGSGDQPPVNPGDTTTVNPQVDPPLANTIGFFMDDWEPRNFTIPSSTIAESAPTSSAYTITVDRSSVITKIPRSFAGNNSNIWMTQMVTESSLIDNLTTLHPHIIRFPGGSIS